MVQVRPCCYVIHRFIIGFSFEVAILIMQASVSDNVNCIGVFSMQ